MVVDYTVSRLIVTVDFLRWKLFPKKRRRTFTYDETPRSDIVSKLVRAMVDVETLAQRSPSKTRKGAGGIPSKARWYQLMAYLAQVLDGVLRNVDLAQYEEKMVELEKAVEELQKNAPKTV